MTKKEPTAPGAAVDGAFLQKSAIWGDTGTGADPNDVDVSWRGDVTIHVEERRPVAMVADADGRPALVDGAFVLVGAALLITPGLLTDFVGLAMLAPPSRRLMREHLLTSNDLIYPVFVHEEKGRAPVPSMPGVERLSVDELLRVGEQALELGVPVLDLFGVPDPSAKTADGRIAWDEDGIIPRAIRALKSRFPELGVMSDQALDPYTTHGQDGLIDESG